MKNIYEAPNAEIISFTSLEQLANLSLNLGGVKEEFEIMSRENLM